jgi:hypothetical protein
MAILRETVHLVRQAVSAGRRPYVLVNNRAEGNAPLTVEGLAGGATRLALGNRFTAVSAVITACQIAAFAGFQFQLRMRTGCWINPLFPLRLEFTRPSLRHIRSMGDTGNAVRSHSLSACVTSQGPSRQSEILSAS